MRNPSLEELDRQALLDYIEALEAKATALEEQMEDLKAQVDVLDLDMDDFKLPEGNAEGLHVSEQTQDLLAEAAELFGGDREEPAFDDFIAEPAPVENGVVKLEPVTTEEAYIPVGPAVQPSPKKTVRVKVKKKRI